MLSRIQEFANQIPDWFSGDRATLLSKTGLWTAWVVYVGYLLLSDFPPGPSLLNTQPETLQEAIDLSLNFWLVLPAAFPDAAPVLNPAFEALFNLVVTWGLLFWGFLIDGRNQRVPMLPFLVGTALLTNVFYLPWLALRRSHLDTPKPPFSPLEKLSESRVFPIVLLCVGLVAIAWGLWARPEFGSINDRWDSLLTLIVSDRLAYSFVVDLLVFWVFQGWLVDDDMLRRNWDNSFIRWIAWSIPFLGLVVYFLSRPTLPETPDD
ncbi:MAG: hypothetical protein ACFE0I_20385 [Elainellaceae cyanobacterium]